MYKKIDKKSARIRRSMKGRMAMKRLNVPRLSVNRTPCHIYVQLIDLKNGAIIASASTIDKTFKTKSSQLKKHMDQAVEIGRLIAERALAAGIKKVAFDRSGFKYHGRIKALADAARKGGLEF